MPVDSRLAGWSVEEIARFSAPEARQGVAADADHVYVIGNRVIGKYDKRSFKKVAGWADREGGQIIHFNAGIVHDGRLVLAHSNYPEVPMTGSIESFDVQTLQPAGSHSFGAYFGSVTWVLRHDDAWFVCFGHYGNRAAEPGRDPTWTSLVRFDDSWRRTGGWVFPKALHERIGKSYTTSGGAFGPGGYLYVTGHDDPELHVLRFPQQGSVLEWVGTLAITAAGQAFCWDPVEEGRFYSIDRPSGEVIISQLVRPGEKE